MNLAGSDSVRSRLMKMRPVDKIMILLFQGQREHVRVGFEQIIAINRYPLHHHHHVNMSYYNLRSQIVSLDLRSFRQSNVPGYQGKARRRSSPLEGMAL